MTGALMSAAPARAAACEELMCSNTKGGRQHPRSFYCPISQQCMHDPVILADGHTYERRYIRRWLRSHRTSPVTGLRLAQKELFPNHALRNAIEEYFRLVLAELRRAIRRSLGSREGAASSGAGSFAMNCALLRNVDALMECSLTLNADHSTERVLKAIMEEAKLLLGAEVASVFLLDDAGEALVSTVNSTGGEIRIPLGAGIAGRVARTGEPSIILDAYSEPRFNRSVDDQTGFRTRSIICVPLKVQDRVVGVAQLINKTGCGLLALEQRKQQKRQQPPQHSAASVAASEAEQRQAAVALPGAAAVDSSASEVHCAFTSDDLQFFQVFAAQAASAIASDRSRTETATVAPAQESSVAQSVDRPHSGGCNSSSSRRSGLRSLLSCLPAGFKRRKSGDTLDSDNDDEGEVSSPLSFATVVKPSEKQRMVEDFAVDIHEGTVVAVVEAAEKKKHVDWLLEKAYASWSFDVFDLAECSDNRPLSALGVHLFKRSGLASSFGLDSARLQRFFEELERGYDEGNQYHNRMHAASVLHLMHALLLRTNLAEAAASALGWSQEGEDGRGERLVRMACLLAAAAHDLEHKGLTNDFLVKTFDERALRFNDLHVNENHHAAAASELLRRPGCDVLSGLSSEEFKRVRSLVICLVLGTDMADNQAIASAFSDALRRAEVSADLAGADASAGLGAGACCGCASGSGDEAQHRGGRGVFAPASEGDAKLMLQMAIKCCDLGHLSLDWDSHVKWVMRLEDEFFAQGDKEKALGFELVSFLMDREKPGASETQVGFLDFVVLPLFRSLAGALPGAAPLLRGAEENRRRWKDAEGAPGGIQAAMQEARAKRAAAAVL